MNNIVNTNHPIYKELWDSRIEINSLDALPENAHDFFPELQSHLNDDLENFEKAWLFDDTAGAYLVVKTGDKFASFVNYPYTELEYFDSIEKALTTGLSSYVPECVDGEWNDEVTEFLVDGEWLVRKE